MSRKSKQEAAEVMVVESPSIVSTFKVDVDAIPDLSRVVPKTVNLAMEYWTPLSEGESKVLVFMRVTANDQIPDFNDPSQLVQKDCAYFVEQTAQGLQILRNASSRLVSIARHFLEGEVYQITYKGMRPNKTNSHKSHFWAVQPVTLAPA
ncbi:MAG: hypothetical protein AAFY70_01800 [Bacteroidota bacterium]